jgi:hypothetical protein
MNGLEVETLYRSRVWTASVVWSFKPLPLHVVRMTTDKRLTLPTGLPDNKAS